MPKILKFKFHLKWLSKCNWNVLEVYEWNAVRAFLFTRREPGLPAGALHEVQDDARAARRHPRAPGRRARRALLHLPRIHRDTQGGHRHGYTWWVHVYWIGKIGVHVYWWDKLASASIGWWLQMYWWELILKEDFIITIAWRHSLWRVSHNHCCMFQARTMCLARTSASTRRWGSLAVMCVRWRTVTCTRSTATTSSIS